MKITEDMIGEALGQVHTHMKQTEDREALEHLGTLEQGLLKDLSAVRGAYTE